MSMDISSFFAQSQPFVDRFNAWAGVTRPAAMADHICYKCGTTEEFENMRTMFEMESGYIYQSIISKRRIAIVKFAMPISTVLGDIWFLELSDQKPDGSQQSGFDHIEIYPTAGSMDELATTFEMSGVVLEKTIRPHHTTYDIALGDDFKVRLESEALIEKIIRDEIRR